ncbi:MAG: 50S ribosomal protein L9 [Zetaproteobacteria bacterium]|nr:MAG: 50S ribosomal protein L9 [Zetaproteobacteria bacterium]
MELILLERIERLGNVGDVVRVKDGYGRNYLLPKKKAIVANSANRKLFERRRALLEEKQRSVLEAAQARAERLGALALTTTRATSDGTHLYGSVTTSDIAALIAEAGEEIHRRDILIDEPIRTLGTHRFRVRLHPDVVAEMHLTVEPENG